MSFEKDRLSIESGVGVFTQNQVHVIILNFIVVSEQILIPLI